jgi:hypothetical protein
VSVALTMERGNRWQWRLKDGEGGGGSVTGADKLLEGGWGTASARSNPRGVLQRKAHHVGVAVAF